MILFQYVVASQYLVEVEIWSKLFLNTHLNLKNRVYLNIFFFLLNSFVNLKDKVFPLCRFSIPFLYIDNHISLLHNFREKKIYI